MWGTPAASTQKALFQSLSTPFRIPRCRSLATPSGASVSRMSKKSPFTPTTALGSIMSATTCREATLRPDTRSSPTPGVAGSIRTSWPRVTPRRPVSVNCSKLTPGAIG